MTELGNAERLADSHGHELRYVRAWKKWLAWDGKRWARNDLGVEEVRAKSIVRSLFVEAAQDSARAASTTNADGSMSDESSEAGKSAETKLKWARASSKASSIASMIRLAQSEPPIAAAPSEFDRDRWVLNVLNGTIDLRTGALRPHRQTDMITRLAPVTYDANAACPRWSAFFERVLPDPEVRTWLQRFYGYALTGDVSEHALAFEHGVGQNGKSTHQEVLLKVLGDYARTAAPDLLLAKHGEAHPTEVADLEGARLVVAQEIDEGRRWSVAMMKRTTGGDRIKARHMKQDFYEFEPTHKFVISGNTKPVLDDQGNAVWRRVRLIPFDVVIPPAERNPHLKEELIEEAPGILAWLVRGCLDWQREGLGKAEAIDRATAEYKKEQDTIGTWIDERCVVMPGAWGSTQKLYDDFKCWLESHGRKAWTLEAMRSRLLERDGITDARKTSARGLQGIGLRYATTEAGNQ
jgi:putative DNA primase/helicase